MKSPEEFITKNKLFEMLIRLDQKVEEMNKRIAHREGLFLKYIWGVIFLEIMNILMHLLSIFL